MYNKVLLKDSSPRMRAMGKPILPMPTTIHGGFDDSLKRVVEASYTTLRIVAAESLIPRKSSWGRLANLFSSLWSVLILLFENSFF